MTITKTARASATPDGVSVVAHSLRLDKTQELPALEPDGQECELGGSDAEAAPREIVDDDITVPVQSSLESTLTFEVLRRQSIETDEDEEMLQVGLEPDA